MKTSLVTVAFAFSMLFATAASAGRTIVINGQMLSPDQIATLDSVTCTRVPTGCYWLLPTATRHCLDRANLTTGVNDVDSILRVS